MKLSQNIIVLSQLVLASASSPFALRGNAHYNEEDAPSNADAVDEGSDDNITQYHSLWHDVQLRPMSAELTQQDNIINFAVEIPLKLRAKMEMQKTLPGNPIKQDRFDDGSARFYSYGDPFFNYGFVPQTWEDPELTDALGNGGDNDPLDIMEVGSQQLAMGSVVPSRVLGALTLIDEGQMDNKIIVISLSDPDADKIYDLDDLETIKPGMIDRLVDWLKMYKTTDGMPENELVSDVPVGIPDAIEIINETHGAWVKMCETGDDHGQGFWLAAAGCQGTTPPPNPQNDAEPSVETM